MSADGEKIIVYIDEDLADLIPGFLENRRSDVEKMNEALAGQDYETIRSLGHSMKGAGGGYGFDAITEIGRSLEEAAEAQNTGTIRTAIGDLIYYLDNVEIIYKEEE